MTRTSRVLEILRGFKKLCGGRGWKTSESEDWVEVNNEFHSFLWARDIHPSSFRKIMSNRKCVVREGLSYRVVEASYTAWLFSQTPSETLLKTAFGNPDIFHKTALYDLSSLMAGKKSCVKLNQTDSPVFKEFESFLVNEFGVKLKPISPSSEAGDSAENLHVAEVA
jgi:hypothetical protein